ncbi:DNA repair protein RecO [Rhodovulum sp. DZ06]|uniref:DNA repair protein RecO n=1 Tax=Rhodovulum sp. DZ06 TaxID=3425126 RepID=UPI003D32FB43
MEHWRDEGVLLTTRRHGEGAAVLEVLTHRHGRHLGLCRGGGSRRMAPLLQPGAQIEVEWTARTADQLGSFRAEPVRSRADAILSDRAAPAAVGAVAAMLRLFLPEREPSAPVYEATAALFDHLGTDPDWPELYAIWELGLLAELGYGLDLNTCAVTGGMQELVWVSPRSGRAVSRAAGEPWADKLLPLPGFLRGVSGGEALDGIRLTGFFLERWAAPAIGKDRLPEARNRLLEALARPTP